MRTLSAWLLVFMLAVPWALAQPGTEGSAPSNARPAVPANLPGVRTKDKSKAPLDPDLLMHLGVTAGEFRSDACVDLTKKVRGKVVGNPMLTNIGPSQGFRFNGTTDWAVLSENGGASKAGLPTRAFTISTWVNVEKLTDGAVIASCASAGTDGKLVGWALGTTDQAFSFWFTTAGADGKARAGTMLKGTQTIIAGRWYNLVVSYDGRTARMFVNGELAGETTEQSGDLAYPTSAPYMLAALAPKVRTFTGTILEVRVLERALTQQQIVEEYTPGVLLAGYQPEYEKTLRFVVRPFLQFVTQDGATIVFETSRPCAGLVEYGESVIYTGKLESSADGTIHKARIGGLRSETGYFYRVRIKGDDGVEVLSDPLTFQTSIKPGTPLAFAVIGDTQKNKPVIEKLQAFAFTLRPHIQIHLGDVVDKGPDREEWTSELLEASYPLMSRVCLYPSIGNHEDNHSNYYRYFALPDPQYYYTYTVGDAQFYSIDTNKSVAPGSEQYEWLDRELGKSTAKWKFVYHHHPVYSSDEDDYGDTYKGPSTHGDLKLRPLAALFEKHHVDIDFNGHIHSYERSWPIYEGKIDQKRGVRYVTSGGGGGGLESAGPVRTFFAQRVYRGHHMCLVTLHDKTLQMQVFDLEGRLIDQMDITKD